VSRLAPRSLTLGRILVVDDRAFNRDFLVSLLEHFGHTLMEACDGQEALDAVQKEPPDLIITDILMPRMNGIEFIARVQKNPASADIPVIFYSATYRVPQARMMARACSAAAVVIPKPSDPEIIVAAVQVALGAPSPTVPAPLERAQGWRNTTLIALMDFQCALAETRDANTVLELACHAAPNLIASKYAALGIEFPDTGVLTQVLVCNLDPLTTFAPAGCVTENFAARITNAALHRGWSAEATLEDLGLPPTHPPVRGLLIAPLQGTRARYGWIYLADRSDGLPFTAADEELLTLLAQQTAAAYENGILAELATRDTLTGLQNRGEFDIALKREHSRALRQCSSLALIMIDVDHFKQCNDRYGHAAGDVVLRNLGAELSRSVRGYDQVFRIGGEEFAVLLPGVSIDHAQLRAEQIRLNVKMLELHHDGNTLAPINLSLGVASHSEQGKSTELLMQAADKALYAAKRSGRDRTCVAPPRETN